VIGWCNPHGSSVLRPGPIAWLNAALRDAERVDVLPRESRFRWAHHMACQAAPRQPPLPLPMNVLLNAWDTKPEAHQGDVPTSRTDTQKSFYAMDRSIVRLSVTRFQVRMNGRLAFPRVCFGPDPFSPPLKNLVVLAGDH
jgi:hypothetical protein